MQEARSVHCSRVSSEEKTGRRSASASPSSPLKVDLTQQDLQSVGVLVQSLRLLLYHVHLLRLLVVIGVDAGVGQHLQTETQGPVNPMEKPNHDVITRITTTEVPYEPE